MILHCAYEKRFADHGRRIHQIWNNVFQNTPFISMKLIVGTRNNPNLSKELIRRNPFKKPKNTEENPT